MKLKLKSLSAGLALSLAVIPSLSSATVQLAVSTDTVSERDPRAVITVFRSEDGSTAEKGESANLFTVAGTAQASIDYIDTAGSVSWGSGDYDAKVFTVPLIDNRQPNATKTFSVKLDPASNATIVGRTETVVSIIDDESAGPGTVSMLDSIVSVSERTLTVGVRVARSSATQGPVSVIVAPGPLPSSDPDAANSATAGSDYVSSSQTLSWADGEAGTKTAVFTINNDSAIEPTEYFQAALSNPSGGVQLGSLTATKIAIVDDDVASPGQFALLPANFSVAEGDVASLAVTRSGGSAGKVSVSFETNDGSARGGNDYSPARSVLTWNDGDVEAKQIAIPTVDNGIVDSAPRTFTVRIVNPTGGAGIDGSRTQSSVAILDIDGLPASSIGFTQADKTVDSGEGAVTLVVTRSGRLDSEVSVKIETADGTAIAGKDYVANSGTLTWAKGDSLARAISIPVTATKGDETRSKTFKVLLVENTGAAIRASGVATTVTISYDPSQANIGCSIVGANARDPMLPAMAILAVLGIVLVRRREKARAKA